MVQIPRSFSHVLNWRAHSKREWIALVLYEVFVASVIIHFTNVLESQTVAKGEEFWVPDLEFTGYSSSALHELMRGYGVDGRRHYLGIAFWDIFVYSFGYAAMLASLLQWSSTSSSAVDYDRRHPATTISMLPWIVWCIDQLENATLVYCLMTFEEEKPSEMWKTVANIGGVVVPTKWVLVGICVLGIGFLSVKKLEGSPKGQKQD